MLERKTAMSVRFAKTLLVLQLLALFVGTQMPGDWRGAVEQSLHAPFGVSSLAHFVVFAGMAGLLWVQPLGWPRGRIVLAVLALALMTEGLQFFAINRHPRWLDVGIDMAGACAGLGLAKLFFLLTSDVTPKFNDQ